MKRVSTILCFITGCISYAQTIVPLENMSNDQHSKNVYYKDVNGVLNKFTGTWMYTDTSHYFKIQFYKLQNIKGGYGLYPGTMREDEVRSFIEYKVLENNTWITKYNTFPNPVEYDEHLNTMAIRGNLTGLTTNKLLLTYDEPSISCQRLKRAGLEIKYVVTSGQPKLQWERIPATDNRSFYDIPCPDGTMIDTSDFIIPYSMLLTKVN